MKSQITFAVDCEIVIYIEQCLFICGNTNYATSNNYTFLSNLYLCTCVNNSFLIPEMYS